MQSTHTRQMGAVELRRLGATVAASGELADLRRKTRLSKNAMARMLGVSIGALTGYENATRAVTAEVALRIGEWYWGAIIALEDALACKVPLHKLIPVAQAAQYLGVAEEALTATAANGVIREEDLVGEPDLQDPERYRYESLGVLGLWLHAEDLPGPTARRTARKRTLVTV